MEEDQFFGQVVDMHQNLMSKPRMVSAWVQAYNAIKGCRENDPYDIRNLVGVQPMLNKQNMRDVMQFAVREYPELITKELCEVQPMSEQTLTAMKCLMPTDVDFEQVSYAQMVLLWKDTYKKHGGEA